MADLSYFQALTLAASVVALVISLLAYRRSGPAAELAKQHLRDLAAEKEARARPRLAWGLVRGGGGTGELIVENTGEVAIEELEIRLTGEGPVPAGALKGKLPLSLRPGQSKRFPARRLLDGSTEIFRASVSWRGACGREYRDELELYWE